MDQKTHMTKTLDLKGKTYISIIDFMKLTKLARVTVKNYVKQGKIDGVNFGHKWWINRETYNLI
jgi:hypothetical protein